MAASLQVQVYDKQRLVFSDEFDGPVELGRQSESREGLYAKSFDGGQWRVVIARADEDSVSRRHALLEPLTERKIRLTNRSTVVPLRLPDGTALAPQTTSELVLPAQVTIGRKTIRLQPAETEDLGMSGLAEATIAPGHFGPRPRLAALELPSSGGIDAEGLVRVFQAISGVLQTAASSSEFFQRAGEAVVEIVGFDAGLVLTLDHEDWRVESCHCAGDPGGDRDQGWQPSRQMLKRLRLEKRTLWHEPDQGGLSSEAASLSGLSAVVVAPILNPQGEIIGALYGERLQGSTSSTGTGTGQSHFPRIRKIDAMVMELLASGVATGLARIQHEKAALAARVQFEQFFTPTLASELAARPDLLTGQNREVSLLFCDIRGFSRISERLGPAATVGWISNVMEVLSDCVLAHHGVLVDYIGDELIAMWGAPQDQPQHAQLACRAALEILDRLPALNQRWQESLQEPIVLGIGINTGVAQVGNTGTSRKFKYGALGSTVNLASRVQGATKYLKTPLIITGTTQAQLDASFSTRRLCKVAVVNMAAPVDLYELARPDQPLWHRLKPAYEEALAGFECKNFASVIPILGNLLAERRDDGPSLLLLARAVSCMVEETAGFDPVWKLPGK
jgi:adenylate cyclase